MFVYVCIQLLYFVDKFYEMKNKKYVSRLRLRRSGSMDSDISMEGLFEEDSSNHSFNGKSRSSNALHVNPWVVKCHHDHLINLATTIEEKNTPQSILFCIDY